MPFFSSFRTIQIQLRNITGSATVFGKKYFFFRMPRNYVTKPGAKRYKKYDELVMKQALEDLQIIASVLRLKNLIYQNQFYAATKIVI